MVNQTLTERQKDVLEYVRSSKVVSSGSNGSVLRALAKRGLVDQHHNSAPGYVYYTWTLSEEGKKHGN